jgi:hypothetical protein
MGLLDTPSLGDRFTPLQYSKRTSFERQLYQTIKASPSGQGTAYNSFLDQLLYGRRHGSSLEHTVYTTECIGVSAYTIQMNVKKVNHSHYALAFKSTVDWLFTQTQHQPLLGPYYKILHRARHKTMPFCVVPYITAHHHARSSWTAKNLQRCNIHLARYLLSTYEVAQIWNYKPLWRTLMTDWNKWTRWHKSTMLYIYTMANAYWLPLNKYFDIRRKTLAYVAIGDIKHNKIINQMNYRDQNPQIQTRNQEATST